MIQDTVREQLASNVQRPTQRGTAWTRGWDDIKNPPLPKQIPTTTKP